MEYKEKAAAAGMFPGGYFKREGRPTEKEILTCRMTDRPLRPLFPKGYLYDTQVIAILLSADGENDSDILSINGASAALCVSDIPFQGPVGAVRVGKIDGQFVINPTNTQRKESTLDLVYVGNKKDVIMIEGSANELPEEEFVQALRFAQENVTKLCEAQEELARVAGKPKRSYELIVAKPELLEIGYEIAGDRIEDAIYATARWNARRRWVPCATKWKPPSRNAIRKPRTLTWSRYLNTSRKGLPHFHHGKEQACRRPRTQAAASPDGGNQLPAFRRSRFRPLRPRRNHGHGPCHAGSAGRKTVL